MKNIFITALYYCTVSKYDILDSKSKSNQIKFIHTHTHYVSIWIILIQNTVVWSASSPKKLFKAFGGGLSREMVNLVSK